VFVVFVLCILLSIHRVMMARGLRALHAGRERAHFCPETKAPLPLPPLPLNFDLYSHWHMKIRAAVVDRHSLQAAVALAE